MPLNPPPVIEDGLVLVTQELVRTDMSRAAEVTFALKQLTGATLADCQDAIDDFQANFNANLITRMDNNVVVRPPTARCGLGTTTPIEVIAAGAATTGGSAMTSAPPNVSLLVKKLTSFGGKKNRGRTYLPFVLETTSVSENGTITAGIVAALQAEWTAFLAQLATDNTPMCIANKVYNTPLPPHYVTNVNVGPLVTSVLVEGMIATQRRRLAR